MRHAKLSDKPIKPLAVIRGRGMNSPKAAARIVRIALAQLCRARDPDYNVLHAEALIEQAARLGADLVALPEGFAAPARIYAEPILGPITQRLAAAARRFHVHVVGGSVGERHGETIYNAACLFDDRGRLVGRYRKRFLWWRERRKGVKPGRNAPVFPTRLGRIGLAICWDLAFPEHFRDLALAGAELVICPAFWQAGDRFGRLSPVRAPRPKPFVRAEDFFVNACVGARAAENGMAVAFVNAAGRTRPGGRPDRLVGLSQVAVPFRGVIALAGDEPALVLADVDLNLTREAERVYGLREDARRARIQRR